MERLGRQFEAERSSKTAVATNHVGAVQQGRYPVPRYWQTASGHGEGGRRRHRQGQRAGRTEDSVRMQSGRPRPPCRRATPGAGGLTAYIRAEGCWCAQGHFGMQLLNRARKAAQAAGDVLALRMPVTAGMVVLKQ